jgi:polysaccharide export outer membrane protein
MLLRIVSLFAGALLTATFVLGSVSETTAQDSYVIKPGDTLQIEVLEDSSLNRTTLVLPDGTISFPMAGTVRTKGRSVEQLRQSLSSALAPNFASAPNVYVSIASLADKRSSSGTARSSRKMDVYALGEVTAPGRMEIKRDTTLLQFLAEAGGLTKFAAEKRIELHRTDSKTGAITTYIFNYRSPGGNSSGIKGSTKLAPGDVVKVPQRRLFE